MVALVDASAFYASCECVFRPDLRGQPIVVLSNNDGCIVALNAEAKRDGIAMGEPFFKARDRLRTIGAHVFSSNYELYADLSRRVMETLGTFTPDVEPYSIDEAFLVFSTPRPADRDPARLHALACAIQERVLQWTKIPVRVSIAPTKTLAKAASEIARRRSPKVAVFPRADAPETRAALATIPVGAVWGVGHRSERKLEAAGVRTALDLADAHDAWVRKTLRVVGLRTAMELRGVSCIPVDRAPPPRRTLLRSRSFGTAVSEPGAMREALSTHAAKACETLRREGLAARAVQVFYRTGHADQRGPHRSVALGAGLPAATAATTDVVRACHRLLRATWAARDPAGRPYRYRKAGVMLLDLAPADLAQADLFRPRAPERERLWEAADRLNHRYAPASGGAPSVFVAAQGTRGAGAPWHLRSEHRSPAYTTRWPDLPRLPAPAFAA